MPKLLLVDDEALVLRSMQKTLLRKGFVVETAGNCTEGLAAFEAAYNTDAPIDMALLDLNMPNFDGIEDVFVPHTGQFSFLAIFTNSKNIFPISQ